MEYVCAVLVLNAANSEITEQSVTKVLKAARVNVDSTRVSSLVNHIEDIDPDEIETGNDGGYTYSALLLNETNCAITERSLTRVLESAGINPDSARVSALSDALENVDINERVEEVDVDESGPVSTGKRVNLTTE